MGQVKERALVSFLARPKPRIPFLGLSLLGNQTETLATQANNLQVVKISPPDNQKVASTISLDGSSLPFSL